MRLPAVAIAAAFASGIALGLHPAVVRNASSVLLLSTGFATGLALIFVGIVLAAFDRLFPAAILSSLTWTILGLLGVCVAEQPLAANHVTSLVEHGQLRLEAPLRWRGSLRDEPAKLPWGYGLEVNLSGVEYEGAWQSTDGGLRLSYSSQPNGKALPELHAGDEVEVLAEARRPQAFRDEGAFDRRAYLAQQNVDLVATLRAPQLIERVASPPGNVAGTRTAAIAR